MFDGNGMNRWSLGQVISCQGIKADTGFMLLIVKSQLTFITFQHQTILISSCLKSHLGDMGQCISPCDFIGQTYRQKITFSNSTSPSTLGSIAIWCHDTHVAPWFLSSETTFVLILNERLPFQV